MRTQRKWWGSGLFGLALVAMVAVTGCATRFSPEMIRGEIVRQRGEDPLGVVEVNLGRVATHLIKKALAGDDGSMPFAGISRMELAVFEMPAGKGPAIDVTRIVAQGWEPVLKTHDDARSGMVLILTSGDDITDLVVVGAGTQKVVYGRLEGRLSGDLPVAFGRVIDAEGADGVQRVMRELSDGSGSATP